MGGSRLLGLHGNKFVVRRVESGLGAARRCWFRQDKALINGGTIMNTLRVIPEFSVDGRRLAERLNAVPIDTIISYAELSGVILRNVQKEGRSALDSARRQLQRESKMVFAPVKNVGLKRLTDSAVVLTSQSTMRHINRSAKRGVQRLSCVQNFDGLTKEEMVRHNTSMSLLGVFYEITKAKSIRQIEAVVAVTQRVLPLADTLKAFRI